MAGDNRTPKTMIQVLQQERLDAQETAAILQAKDDGSDDREYKELMTKHLGVDTMDKIEQWRLIASFVSQTQGLAEFLYEWTTGDCSVQHHELYALCDGLMKEFATLIVGLGIITDVNE